MKSHKRIKRRGPFLFWPAATPPADPKGLVAWLSIRPTVRPFLSNIQDAHCHACQTPIQPGDTAWDPVQQLHVHVHFCHRCGVLFALHSGAWTPQEVLQIPAIGGPPRRDLANRPKSFNYVETG